MLQRQLPRFSQRAAATTTAIPLPRRRLPAASGAPSDTAAPDTAAPTPTETVAVNTTEPTSGGPNAAKFGGGGGDGTVKIGFTAPLTGALAGFGEANPFILDGINKLAADGIMLGDKSYKVEIIQKDVESNTDTAASQAGSLILDDGVDLMLAIATPEMINPVADQCEANGVPCLSTLAPWQPYFLGRGGDPAKGFDWTYHFFWGAEQLVGVFADMWQTVETNKIVGLLCPNDPDGNALASPDTGFPAGAKAAGYTMIDPGRFEDAARPTSAASSASSSNGTSRSSRASRSLPTSPTFWTQANQQGFKPKLVTMAKAVLFSSAVEALGDIGDGLASEVWWTPNHPFSSSLTGETSKQLGDEYRPPPASSGRSSSGSSTLCSRCASTCCHAPEAPTSRQSPMLLVPTKLDTMVGPDPVRRQRLAEEHQPDLVGRWAVAEEQPVASSRSSCSSPTTRCRPRSRPMAR